MESEMTMISKEFFNSARSNLFTIQDAVQYLEKEAKSSIQKYYHSVHEIVPKFLRADLVTIGLTSYM